jgi:hypothetical protein
MYCWLRDRLDLEAQAEMKRISWFECPDLSFASYEAEIRSLVPTEFDDKYKAVSDDFRQNGPAMLEVRGLNVSIVGWACLGIMLGSDDPDWGFLNLFLQKAGECADPEITICHFLPSA